MPLRPFHRTVPVSNKLKPRPPSEIRAAWAAQRIMLEPKIQTKLPTVKINKENKTKKMKEANLQNQTPTLYKGNVSHYWPMCRIHLH